MDKYFHALETFNEGKIDKATGAMWAAMKAFERIGLAKGVFMSRLHLARMYRGRGEYDKALSVLRQARAMEVRSRDLLGEGVVLEQMADLEMDRSRFDEARKLLGEALTNATAVEYKPLAASIKRRMAWLETVQGNYTAARKLIEEYRKVRGGAPDPVDEFHVLVLQGKLDRLAGKYDQALKSLDKALAMTGGAISASEDRSARIEKALILASMGDRERAAEILAKVTETASKAGDIRSAAIAETLRVSVIMRKGEAGALLDVLHRAARDLGRVKTEYELAWNKLVEGRLLTITGKLLQAERALQEARRTFERLGAKRGRFLAGLALAQVRNRRGEYLSAGRLARSAADAAKGLGLPLGLAQSALVGASVALARGDSFSAVPGFKRALGLYRSLKIIWGEARCRIGRAKALISMGFFQRAEKDLKALDRIQESGKDLLVKGDLFFLRGLLAQTRGESDQALEEYQRASTIFDKLGVPFRHAVLLEARAAREESLRNYLKAEAFWQEAEKAYASMSSPGGILRCRKARVRLALDRLETSKAGALVRAGIRFSGSGWKPRPNPPRFARASFPLLASDAGQDRFFDDMEPWPDVDRQFGEGDQQSKGDDGALMNAELSALNALVQLAQGKTAAAERSIAQAIKRTEALPAKAALKRFKYILAQVYMEQGDYGKAEKAFEESGSQSPWERMHARAMELGRQGRFKEALDTLSKAITSLELSETRRGLWLVSATECRRRERLYEDYVDLLTGNAHGSGPDSAAKAWQAGQRLKMVRLVHDRTLVGATGFPGVPPHIIERLRTLQYEAVNAERRARHPSLLPPKGTGDQKGKGVEKREERTPEEVLRDISKVFDTAAQYGEFVKYVRAQPLSLDEVRKVLSGDDAYLSFSVTAHGIHGFFITGGSIVARTLTDNTDDIHSWTGAVRRDVKGNRPVPGKSAVLLGNKLIGPFSNHLPKEGTLYVELDGFLPLVPFEVLVVGEWPKTYKERQLLKVLGEQVHIVRTTSAARFVRSRKVDGARALSLAVFADPVLPGLRGSTGAQRASGPGDPTAQWRRRLSRIAGSSRRDSAGLGVRLSRLFGDKGTLFSGESASMAAFLGEGLTEHALVHLFCPLLLPDSPVGRTSQPYILFSGSTHDPWSGMCGISRLQSLSNPVALVTVDSLAAPPVGGSRGLVLFLESLGYAGVRSILLPQWPRIGRDDERRDRFMVAFYSELNKGSGLVEAIVQGRKACRSAPGRKSRFAPFRFVIF